jgi:hypothetical protein
MKKEKQQEEEVTVTYPTYTAKDFFEIKAELEKYAIDKEFEEKDGSKKMVHFVPASGLRDWYILKGGLAPREEWTVRDIPLFKELQDKISQYENWCRRREYAQTHAPEYKDVVNNMRVGE